MKACNFPPIGLYKELASSYAETAQYYLDEWSSGSMSNGQYNDLMDDLGYFYFTELRHLWNSLSYDDQLILTSFVPNEEDLLDMMTQEQKTLWTLMV